MLSEREDAFEKNKDTEETEIWEKKQQTDVALWNAKRSERRAEELGREQQEINYILNDTKAQLRKVTAENDRYRKYEFDNIRLKKEIDDHDKKHREEVEKLTGDYSVKIKNLAKDVADKERIISEQQSGISELEAQISEKDSIISKNKDTIKTWKGLYDNACAVGEYACRKLGRDFDRCLDMKIDNYRLSYIFGDERSR